jgi:hypothetical protein
MRLLPDQATEGREVPAASGGGRRAKPIAGLAYLYDDGKKRPSKEGGEKGAEGEEQPTQGKRRKAPAKDRKKARRINYELLSQPEGLPALFNNVKSLKIDETLPVVRRNQFIPCN